MINRRTENLFTTEVAVLFIDTDLSCSCCWMPTTLNSGGWIKNARSFTPRSMIERGQKTNTPACLSLAPPADAVLFNGANKPRTHQLSWWNSFGPLPALPSPVLSLFPSLPPARSLDTLFLSCWCSSAPILRTIVCELVVLGGADAAAVAGKTPLISTSTTSLPLRQPSWSSLLPLVKRALLWRGAQTADRQGGP